MNKQILVRISGSAYFYLLGRRRGFEILLLLYLGGKRRHFLRIQEASPKLGVASLHVFLRKRFIRPVPSLQVQAATTVGNDGGLGPRAHPLLYLRRDPGLTLSELVHPLVFPSLPSWELGVEIGASNKGKMRFL